MRQILLSLLLALVPADANAECPFVSFADALKAAHIGLLGRVVSSSNKALPGVLPSEPAGYSETTVEVQSVYQGAVPKVVRVYQLSNGLGDGRIVGDSQIRFESAIGHSFVMFGNELTRTEREKFSVPPGVPAFMLVPCLSISTSGRDLSPLGSGQPPQ
jgi:hypothetical protein